MKFKKQIIMSPLLSLGLLVGSSFFENFAVLAAPFVENNPKAQVVSISNNKIWEKFKNKWEKSLTIHERLAIKDYSDIEYVEINNYLKEGKSVDLKTDLGMMILNIDNALYKGKVPEDLTVYRYVGERTVGSSKGSLNTDFCGINLDSLEGIKDYEKYIKEAIKIVERSINKTLIQPAYISTSFIKELKFQDKPIRFEIKVPKGTYAADISGISVHPEEKELLLSRNNKFKITGASTIIENGHKILIVRVDLLSN